MLIFVLLPSLVFWTAGCADKEASSTPTLSIRRLEVSSAVSDEGDYTVQPGATFDRGEVVWLYSEVRGITLKASDGKFEYWVKSSSLKIFDPDGNLIAHLVDFVELHETAVDDVPEFLWFGTYYESTADDIAGQYKFELTVKDELSGATATRSATFTLQ